LAQAGPPVLVPLMSLVVAVAVAVVVGSTPPLLAVVPVVLASVLPVLVVGVAVVDGSPVGGATVVSGPVMPSLSSKAGFWRVQARPVAAPSEATMTRSCLCTPGGSITRGGLSSERRRFARAQPARPR
jgi:hypothetical protein